MYPERHGLEFLGYVSGNATAGLEDVHISTFQIMPEWFPKVDKQTEACSLRSGIRQLYLLSLVPIHIFFFLKGNFKFIYLFIFGCVGSSFLCEGFP